MAYETEGLQGLTYRIANALAAGTLAIRDAAASVTTAGGTIPTSGATVNVSATAANRIEIINPSTATLWARWGGTPAVNGANSFPIVANGSYAPLSGTTGTLTLLSTAANQPYTVNVFA